MFLPQVLDFVDEHGNEVLNLGSFALLPQHVVRLILARDLKADEFSKFQVTGTVIVLLFSFTFLRTTLDIVAHLIYLLR